MNADKNLCSSVSFSLPVLSLRSCRPLNKKGAHQLMRAFSNYACPKRLRNWSAMEAVWGALAASDSSVNWRLSASR